MNFSLTDYERWTAPAEDWLAANPAAPAHLSMALHTWAGQKVDVSIPVPGFEGWMVCGDRPLPNGQQCVTVFPPGSTRGPLGEPTYQLAIPASAEHPPNWNAIVPYAGIAVGALGLLWWWRRRKSSGGMLMAMPEGLCCPSTARKLSSGACQDRETKKFVKSVPCVRRLPAVSVGNYKVYLNTGTSTVLVKEGTDKYKMNDYAWFLFNDLCSSGQKPSVRLHDPSGRMMIDIDYRKYTCTARTSRREPFPRAMDGFLFNDVHWGKSKHGGWYVRAPNGEQRVRLGSPDQRWSPQEQKNWAYSTAKRLSREYSLPLVRKDLSR